MTVPTISNLPTVPATSDPNFETEAPALFNHIKNTFVSEMNSAISFINSSTFDATVEFKNANFTAARNFLYMIDTSSGAVSVTLPANPSTGDQLLLMDQKRTFATNNLTIVRNGQNINGAASNVVSKSTGALIRCIFQSSYGWTVDLYEGEWESGTSAGDLVYNGGKVGIGTSAPSGKLDVNTGVMSGNVKIGNFDNVVNGNNTSQLGNGTKLEFIADTNPRYSNHDPYTVAYVKAEYDGTDFDTKTGDTALTFATYDGYAGASNGVLSEKMRITSAGNVGIGTSAPDSILEMKSTSNTICTIKASSSHVSAIDFADADASQRGYIRYNHSDDSMQLWSAGSNRLTIDSSGKVGIGTSSPGAKLHATGDIVAQNATNPTVSANDNGTLGASDKSVYMRYDTTNDVGVVGSFHNGTGAKNLVLNQLGGNVGIGTSAPGAKLEVESASGAGNTNLFRLIRDGGYGDTTFNQWYTDGAGTPSGGNPTALYGLNMGLVVGSANNGKVAVRLESQGGSNTIDDSIVFRTANSDKVFIDSSGNVEVNTGNLVIGTAGKGIDFSASSHFGGTGGGTGMSSELLDDYEEGTFTPAFIDTNGDATFTHDIQKGRYTKVGDCVYFSLTIGTDSVTAGTGDLKISGLPFTAQNSESEIKPSGAVGINYSWGTSPTHWLVNANSDAVILYKSVNPLTASKSADCGTTVDDNRLFMHGFYFV